MKKYYLTLVGVMLFSLSYSQNVLNEGDEDINNSVFNRNQHSDREIVDLAPLREADVMWSSKIWREIDLRQKINHPLYYPQESESSTDETVDRDNLFKALYDAATLRSETNIRVFNAETDDEFQVRMTPTELIEQVEGKELPIYFKSMDIETEGEDSLDVNGDLVLSYIDREAALRQSDIVKWRLKEQWFFDKQRSVMDVRIIGLAPLKQDRDKTSDRLTGTYTPICWFYFQDARKVMKKTQAFNLVGNEAENKTFEDIFMKRMFSSTIVKKGNVYNRKVDQYMVGLDALLEAESLKAEIFNFEHDLWEY